MLVVIIIGGIYSGLFTATEAAAVSAVYAFFVAVYVYGEIGLRDVPRVLLRSANLSAMLLYIITNAVLFSFVLAACDGRLRKDVAMANLDLLVKAWDTAHWEFTQVFEGLADEDVWRRPDPRILSVGELAGHIAYWEAVMFMPAVAGG